MEELIELIEEDFLGDQEATRAFRGQVAVSLILLGEKAGFRPRRFAQKVGPKLADKGATKHTIKLAGRRRRCYVCPADWFSVDIEEGPTRPTSKGTSTLSDQEVREIRVAVDDLVEEYGISYGTLAAIGYRNTRKDA